MNEFKEMLIYVVDNDHYNVKLIEILLKEAGFDVVDTFLSAAEMLKAIENKIPDIILSDIMMPGMNGYELCQTVKKNDLWKHIPIIMITAASMENSEPLKKSFESGAMDFISKPVNHIELVARVTSALKMEKQRKSLAEALIQVKTLQGLLPICSYCKKIRDDENYWQEIESYISNHSEVFFSHSICPDCYQKYVLPELNEIKRKGINKNDKEDS
ncbi:MAG: response regulator [Candidatus Cloacimonetes bacterium]|nr:response regulator [Candidatus Cloacimonadota bacterium]